MNSSRRKIAIVAVLSAALAVGAAAAPAQGAPTARSKGNKVRISAPATATQWAKINIKCKAPVSAAGGTMLFYQNGTIIRLRKATVDSSGRCNFWIKSGLLGVNNLDLAIEKGNKTFQSNDIQVTVTAN